jgi:hypothetical protein
MQPKITCNECWDEECKEAIKENNIAIKKMPSKKN